MNKIYDKNLSPHVDLLAMLRQNLDRPLEVPLLLLV